MDNLKQCTLEVQIRTLLKCLNSDEYVLDYRKELYSQFRDLLVDIKAAEMKYMLVDQKEYRTPYLKNLQKGKLIYYSH